ncbi:hypothetical protein CYMTET_41169 [Cymbomonas tetramitiformis]|uniref:Uncharacterized protein n=1 Tax=Cymbomonas tetramitiformis TaxID=36881 RepID=A0AAE0C803_9CHLO|nr:hypothetical protein CYMTET_41169 [Cymbomonas tetramitiformis]
MPIQLPVDDTGVAGKSVHPLVRIAADVPRLELNIVEVQKVPKAAHSPHEVSCEVRRHRHYSLVVAVKPYDLPPQLAQKGLRRLEDRLQLQVRDAKVPKVVSPETSRLLLEVEHPTPRHQRRVGV